MKPKFSQIWDLCRNRANNTYFHYSTNSIKIHDKFFNKFKKPFLTHSLNFWGKNNFSGKSGFVTHNLKVSSTMPKFRKTNDAIPRKCPDRRTEGRTERRTDRPYFIGLFWLPLEIQKSRDRYLPYLLPLGWRWLYFRILYYFDRVPYIFVRMPFLPIKDEVKNLFFICYEKCFEDTFEMLMFNPLSASVALI